MIVIISEARFATIFWIALIFVDFISELSGLSVKPVIQIYVGTLHEVFAA
jgi:hypothetical protein